MQKPSGTRLLPILHFSPFHSVLLRLQLPARIIAGETREEIRPRSRVAPRFTSATSFVNVDRDEIVYTYYMICTRCNGIVRRYPLSLLALCVSYALSYTSGVCRGGYRVEKTTYSVSWINRGTLGGVHNRIEHVGFCHPAFTHRPRVSFATLSNRMLHHS